MIEQIGGRKFIFAVLLVGCVFTLAVLSRISYEQFISAALIALGIFSGANAIQKIKVER